MFESVLVRNKSIREDLVKKELTPKQIAEKHDCAVQTIYDISYRMKRDAGVPPQKRRLRRKKTIKIAPKTPMADTYVVKPMIISYKHHLEAEKAKIQEQISILKNVEAFLSVRIKEIETLKR